MTKTIEEAAREYANENMWYPGETSYESDITAMEDSFADAFKAGAERMREYIFQIYNDCGGDMDFVKWKLNRDEDE